MTKMDMAWLKHVEQTQEQGGDPPGKANPRLDRLVGYLMSDRGVLRTICAPRGFGRTTLANRYAELLFPQERVMRIDGSSPGFLRLIDTGDLAHEFLGDLSESHLAGKYVEPAADTVESQSGADRERRILLIDDLRHLDQTRAQVLSDAIDAALEQGDEVVVVTTPANDCLGILQPDRITVSATDLVLSVRELSEQKGLTMSEADGRFNHLEGIPSMIWMDRREAVECLLEGFSDEELPSDFLLPASAMLVLGSGKLDELDLLGISLSDEVYRTLCSDYPLFGLRLGATTFATIPVTMEEMIRHPSLIAALEHEEGLLDKLLSTLLAKDAISRLLEVLMTLFTSKHRTKWIVEYGWEIIDRGYARELLDLGEAAFGSAGAGEGYLALRAWMSYLVGNQYETRVRIADGIRCAPAPPVLNALLVLGLVIGSNPMRAGVENASDNETVHRRLQFLESVEMPPRDMLCKTVCDLECLAVREEEGFAPCPFGVEGERGRCAGWSLLQRALAFGSSGVQHDWDKPDSKTGMPGFLVWAHKLRYTGFYRMALVAVAAHVRVTKGIVRDAVETEMARLVIPVVARGVTRISEALLVRWFESEGAIAETGDAPTRQARLRTASLLSTLKPAGSLEMLSILASGLPLNSGMPGLKPLPARDEAADGEQQEDSPETSEVRVMEPPDPILYLRFFGGFQASTKGKPIYDERWRRKGLRGLLTLLALSRGGEATKTAVYAQLWPTADARHARDSLYNITKILRDILKDVGITQDVIIKTDEFCRFDRTLVDTDLFAFDRLVRRVSSYKLDDAQRLQIYSQIDSLYEGDIVEFDTKDMATASQNWYRSVFVDTMISASAFAREKEEGLASLWFARRAYEHGLGREDVFRTLMQAQSFNGQYDEAQRTFEQCRYFMEREFGISVSQETLDCYNEFVTRRRLQHAL